MAERTTRVCAATGYQPSAIAGSTRLFHESRPNAGSQFSCTAKNRISSSPTQKLGMACPSMAKTLAKRSNQEPR